MNYIKNFLLVKGEDAISNEALAWLTSAHLPHMVDNKAKVLLVFNINKHYLQEYIIRFNPSEWKWSPVDSDFIDGYVNMFEKAEHIIAKNALAYHSFTHEDAASVEPLVYQKLVKRAFNGTSYQSWKIRFYLCRGMLSEQFADRLSENATAIYKSIFQEAEEATNITIGNPIVHIYFERQTLFSGLFCNSDEYMCNPDEAKRLAKLEKKMTTLIKEYGFERNISGCCPIDFLLEILGLEFPQFEIDFNNPLPQKDIRDFAIVPFSQKNESLILDTTYIYGLDRLQKQYLLVNVGNHLLSLIDYSDRITFSRTIPTESEEYGQFFDYVQRQINYNKALPYVQSLPNCFGKGEKIYNHLKGLDTRPTESRIVVEDEPHRVIKLSYDEDEANQLISQYITNKIGSGFLDGYNISIKAICEPSSPIIKWFFVRYEAISGEDCISLDDRICDWFEGKNFEVNPITAVAKGNTIVDFFEEVLSEIPELTEYFKII